MCSVILKGVRASYVDIRTDVVFKNLVKKDRLKYKYHLRILRKIII